MHSSPPTPFLHAFFIHQYSRPGQGMFPRLSVASPRPSPRLQALRRRPLRALLSLTLEFHLVLLPLASGKRKGHAIPPPQTSVWKVDRRGESSSWSSQVRRTRTRSGREGTRGTERSPRRRVGRTNLTVGRGEPARAGCFAIDSQGLGLKSQWKTRAHFGGHLSLLRRL